MQYFHGQARTSSTKIVGSLAHVASKGGCFFVPHERVEAEEQRECVGNVFALSSTTAFLIIQVYTRYNTNTRPLAIRVGANV